MTTTTTNAAAVFAFALLALSADAKAGEQRKSYEGFKLYRIRPETASQIDHIHYLWQNDTTMDLNFWTDPSTPTKNVDIMVGPGSQLNFEGDMSRLSMNRTVLMQNVQDAIETESISEKYAASFQRDFTGNSGLQFDFGRYPRYRDVVNFLRQAESQYPNLAEVITMRDASGRLVETWDGNRLYMMKLANKNSRTYGNSNRPAFWIDGGIHAREWVAIMVPIYIIYELLSKYNTDAKYRQYLDEMDWYILPVLNPDGYEHSHTVDRMWRKNRNPNSGERLSWCIGVDLNRNFNWKYGGEGSSFDPCRETYHGERAFSEPESKAVLNHVSMIGNRLQGFITMHSYSQIWMYPFGHKRNAKSHDWQELRDVAERGRKKLREFYGTNYLVDTGANALYPASGGSDDWAKGVKHVKFVYLLELRPEDHDGSSSHGFLLPASQIRPTALETWGGVQVVADEVLTRAGKPVTQPGTAPPPPLTTTTTAPPDPDCTDQAEYCRWWRSLGFCFSKKEDMIQDCPATCDLCREEFIITTPLTPGDCVDTEQFCGWWASLGACTAWKQDMARSCAKTCLFCEPAAGSVRPKRPSSSGTVTRPRPSSACRDRSVRQCKRWLEANGNRCSSLGETARNRCKKSCGACR